MAKSRLKRQLSEEYQSDDTEQTAKENGNPHISNGAHKKQRMSQSQEPAGNGDLAMQSQDSDNETARTNVTRLRGKQTRQALAAEPEFGIIESIELVDFMCHEKTVVNLTPRLNFITGQNGSGKSAILTALIVALGGKVSVTNRATSLKDLIRGGRSTATVRIKLRNRGSEAYYPDKYGQIIVIERQLNSSGTASSYKISNGDTRSVVSRKKEDVVNITDHMGIQVDNPINILSQDAAREFLSKTNPDSMYMFFLKGTQLFQLSEDLESVRLAIARAESSIDRKKEVLPEMRAEKKRWEQHYEDMRQARDISARLNSLGQQMAWALVEEAEAEVGQVDEEIEVRRKKVALVDEKIDSENTAIQEIEQQVRQMQEQAESQLAQITPLQEERSAPVSAIEQIKSDLRVFKQNEIEINTEARRIRERIDSLNKEIDAERARLQGTDQAGKERLRSTIASLEESVKEEEARIAQLQSDQQQYEQQSKALTDSKSENNRTADKARTIVSRTKANLEDLKRQTANRLNAFGRGVPEALALIKKTQWRGMRPVGPIGDCIKLRDRRWAPVIETTLDKSLNSFLVDSHADRVTLDGIFRRVGCQSRIIICNTELFDYSAGEPSTEYMTMLRALDISNEVVKRQLINLNRIEQVILVEQRALGDKIMSSNNGGFPKNVIACLTVDGYSVGSRSGGLSTQAMNLVRQSSRLGGDITAVIQREEQQLVTQTRELEEAKKLLDKADYELKSLQNKHQAAAATVRKCKETINRAKAEIEKTRDLLRSNEPTKVAGLEAELETFTSQLELIQTQFRDHHLLQVAKKEELQQHESDIALIDRKIETVRAKAESLRQNADNKSSESQRHAENIEYYRSKRVKLEEAAQHLVQRRNELQQKVDEVTVDARKLSEERVHVEHPANRLDRMITECRARLDEIERTSSMSLAEVSEKAQNHIDAYNKAKDELRTITRLISSLKSAHQMRLQMWTQFRDSMTMRTKMHFTTLLQRRGYAGKLDFDHSQRTLVPKVKTDQDIVSERASKGASNGGRSQNGNSGASYQRKDTKSLSGGEKSFTTICLLLALWEAMNCPVRALDEFDVFMDAANRAIAMNMMVGSAQSKSETQFILITPQDLGVKPSEIVSILRLAPPKR
ncbi:Structural maintenance of chromosomes protein 6 [Coemansia sp. RSA 485]|nr:Structural maintenance of chromosomes protein 6 [Coemansia sp. RSA 485]